MRLAMAESVTQSETHSIQSPDAITPSETCIEETPQPASTTTPTSPIIWTPSFIIIFALVLVLGLSAEGIVTQGWATHFYPRDWTLLAHVLIVLGLWISIVIRVRSYWIRIGGLFACIWAFFTGFYLVLDLLPVNHNVPIVAHLNAATAIALLGSFLCLSLDRTPFRLWDARFFRYIFIVGTIFGAAAFLLMPANKQSLSILESDIAITSLVLSVLVWWIRPSCWKAQPGPTFLFGIAPAILLFLVIPNGIDAATNLFLSQIAFLCLILGTMRILQIYHVLRSDT
jgi:hypothetical protein